MALLRLSADSWLFDAMEKGRSAGSHTGDYGINIYELRSKMFDILRNEGMDRPARHRLPPDRHATFSATRGSATTQIRRATC